jgi:helicase
VQKIISKTRFRLQNGIKEELIPLVRLKNIGRVRARKLFGNSIKDIGDVKKADLTTLSQILGKNIALDIKKQVGEGVDKVSKGKRKGQLSMEKF